MFPIWAGYDFAEVRNTAFASGASEPGI